MLHTSSFSKATAWLGIVISVVGLVFFPTRGWPIVPIFQCHWQSAVVFPAGARFLLPGEREYDQVKAMVIYDSVFGNTEKIAQSVAATLQTTATPVSQVTAEQVR